MAEVEERLLRMDDFEDIVTCLKMDPATWSDDKLRGLLTAAYLSSVSEDEIQLACQSVTAESLHAIRSVDGNGQHADGVDAVGDHLGHASQSAGSSVAASGSKPASSSHHEGLESMQALGGIDDLMKHELEQLTWAGPSGGEGPSTDTVALTSVKDPHTFLRISGDVGASGCDSADSRLAPRSVDTREPDLSNQAVHENALEPEHVVAGKPEQR